MEHQHFVPRILSIITEHKQYSKCYKSSLQSSSGETAGANNKWLLCSFFWWFLCIWVLCADISELSARQSPKRKNTTFKTWRKFEIKNKWLRWVQQVTVNHVRHKQRVPQT